MNIIGKNLIVSLFILTSPTTDVSGQSGGRGPFQPGEVLRFKVRWGFVRLGSITLKQEPPDQRDPSKRVLTLSGESSPLLKFIDAAFVNRAVISEKSLVSYDYTSEVGRKKHLRISQRLDPASGMMAALEVRDGKEVVNTRIPDGKSLFNDLNFLMYVRTFAGSGTEATLPSVYKDSVVTTHVTLMKEVEQVRVQPFEKPVRAYVFEAEANWSNQDIAGFRGEFRGYVGADPGAMLLKMEAKVLIGSIVVELESFEYTPVRTSTTK